jgi:HME family heavy-metal exporter
MLDRLISFSLNHRLLILGLAVVLLGVGSWQASKLPVDVFPNLNRPRVVIITEAHGMAPEEVESLITFPIETAVNGASGVVAVRSSSGVGISVVYVEFDWNTDIYVDRQIVNERLQLASQQLPEDIKPTLAPVSSIMGQVLMYGMWSEGNETDPMEVRTLADWVVRQRLLTIPGVAQVFTIGGGRKQFQVLVDPDSLRSFGLTMEDVHQGVAKANLNATGGYLDQRGDDELLVRGLGRASSRDDLLKTPLATRRGRSISLEDIGRVVEAPQVQRGDASSFMRNGKGEIQGGAAVVLTINKQPGSDTRAIDDAVRQALVDLSVSLPKDIRITKVYSQRAFIDRAIENVVEALADGGVLVLVILFVFLLNFRTTFITLTAIPLSIIATACVFAALNVSINTMTLGGIAVAIGELVDDAIVDVENIHRRLRQNRQSKAQHPGAARSLLRVVYDASREIRSSVVFGTAIVVLAFIPLFALEGMEGRVFSPLALACIVSLVSSLAVSLTVTPVLSSLLLSGNRVWQVVTPFLSVFISGLVFFWVLPRTLAVMHWEVQLPGNPLLWTLGGAVVFWIGISAFEQFRRGDDDSDGRIVSLLKEVAGITINFSTRFALPVLMVAVTTVLIALVALVNLQRDRLPPFNEGSIQVNVMVMPGKSLATSNDWAEIVEQRLLEIDSVRTLVRRTGRAELDEHAEGVNVSEMVLELDPNADREQTIRRVRETMEEMKQTYGIVSSTEQPLAHLISHMLSGVKAQIGIKLYGDDLDLLRSKANEMKSAIDDIEGLKDVLVEQQTNIPQLRIELDRDALMQYGVRAGDVMELIETAMNGRVVSQIVQGQRKFDLVVRLDESFREDVSKLRRLAISLPDGGVMPLDSLARIYESSGPNRINREQVRRRIILQANVAGRGVVDVVDEIKSKLVNVELPPGYFLEYGGEFESQQKATRLLALLSVVVVIGMFLVLHTLFGNANFSAQVLVALPAAFVGAVAALVLTDQKLTVSAMVGFISLCGIASRNGILLLSHYLHLVRHEGETWSRSMVQRAGQERMSPVLMTALTSGLGLLPLAVAGSEPGREILYPIATVIIGGLITSTIAEFTIRPALFWLIGRKAGQQIIDNGVSGLNDLETRQAESRLSTSLQATA